MPDANRARLVHAVAACTATVLLCAVVLAWVMELWQADLHVPFAYRYDALSIGAPIKGMTENGWYLHNDRLGAPGSQDLHDYPVADGAHWLGLRLICLFVRDWAVVLNVFFLLTFPLTALCALLAFRQLGLSYPSSVVGGILFAFQPYHFTHGEFHLFLAAYYTVPLMATVALWVFCDPDLLTGAEVGGRRGWNLGNGRSRAAIAVCILTGSSGIYYALFGCFFVLLAGLLAQYHHGRPCRVLAGVRLTAVVFATILLNVSPTILYQHAHGPNRDAVRRSGTDAELYALNLTRMLLPVPGHRVPSLARFRDGYSSGVLSGGDDRSTPIGSAAAAGFLLLILGCLTRPAGKDGFDIGSAASKLVLGAVVLAVTGGLGPLVCYALVPPIRCYGRIVVYVAFFSLLALFRAVEGRFPGRYRSSAWGRLGHGALLGVILALGVVDQASTRFVPPYDALRARYRTDQRFVAAIEASVPVGSRIFQLPYLAFPESVAVHNLCDYDHLVGYLHSRTLKWSYGAMRGREADRWQQAVSALPTPRMVRALQDAGFRGAYVDRRGYPDRGAAVEEQLSRVLGARPIVCDDGLRSFFLLPEGSPRSEHPAPDSPAAR